MTRIIRKMCNYFPEDRYQSIDEVLLDLSALSSFDKDAELSELIDIVTQTYGNEDENVNSKIKYQTRFERKKEQYLSKMLYRRECVKYFIVITGLLFLTFTGLQPSSPYKYEWIFYMFSIAAAVEALFQQMHEYASPFGIVLVTSIGLSIGFSECHIVHIVLIFCIITGSGVFSMAGAIATVLWLIISGRNGMFPFLSVFSQMDMGWIFLTVLLLVTYRFFVTRIMYEKDTYYRMLFTFSVYDKIFILMFIVGLILFFLQKTDLLIVPTIIEKMHFARTGAITFAGILVFKWRDGFFSKDHENDAKVMERGY